MRTLVSAREACGFQLSFGQQQAGFDVCVIEMRKHLVGLHLHSFFDQDFRHFAGDFGRNGRLPPSGDVARAIQHRAIGGARAVRMGNFARCHGPNLNHGGFPEPPDRHANAEEERDGNKDRPGL